MFTKTMIRGGCFLRTMKIVREASSAGMLARRKTIGAAIGSASSIVGSRRGLGRVSSASFPLWVRPVSAAGHASKRGMSSSGETSRDFSEEEVMIQESVSKFATDVIAPRVREMDETCIMDPAIISGLFENGLMGVEAPEEFGGSGLNFMSACIVVEEIAKIDPAVAVLVDIQNTLIINMLRFWGSEGLQAKYFPRLCSNTVSSFCLSEVGSGSDAFSLSTKATLSPNGSYYTIEGEKLWISNSEQAELFFVFANVDPAAGYKGITCFVVDKEGAVFFIYIFASGVSLLPSRLLDVGSLATEHGGVTVGVKEDKLGIRASSTCPVTFSACEVPKENVLGDVGQGYKYAIEILNEGRIGIGAQMVGLARGCLEDTLPYLYERRQFGLPVGDFQGMQHQVAQIATEIEAATVLYRSAARLKEAGKPFVKEAAMAKLYTSQVAERTASKCVEWLGGIGFTKAFLAEKFYRDCKIGAIYEGTSNIQLSTIAKLIKKDHSS